MRALQVPDLGTPPIVEDCDALAKSIAEISRGHGPIAIDAEQLRVFATAPAHISYRFFEEVAEYTS